MKAVESAKDRSTRCFALIGLAYLLQADVEAQHTCHRAHHQRGADEQDDGKRHLQADERLTEAHPTGSRPCR